MKLRRRVYECSVILVAIFALPLDAVTVNPFLCPTNKIAPHRRIANWDYARPRTFGAFYDLFTHNNRPNLPNDAPNAPSDLQEKPQEDEPDDCGEIEDYDENDLSSVTSQSERRHRNKFFNNFFRPPQYVTTSIRPPVPVRPLKPNLPPTRPPYWSGGVFGDNGYRPPLQQFPSDNTKPVHEHIPESQAPYRPDVVGGSFGHIVGVPPGYPRPEATSRRTYNYFSNNFSPSTQRTMYSTRRPRHKTVNTNSVLGSFYDLFFK